MLNHYIFINFCKNENINYFRESFKLRLKVEAEGDYIFKIWQDFSRFNLELGDRSQWNKYLNIILQTKSKNELLNTETPKFKKWVNLNNIYFNHF